MTIDEVRQELEWELVRDKMALAQRTVSAIQLAIEALWRLQEIRQSVYLTLTSSLPGETE